jgi:hypothetical protein
VADDETKIIRFPGASYKLTGKPAVDPASKLAVGPISFFCTSCGETCHADFKRMIFKTVEFFCAGCGTSVKLTNPAFAAAPPRLKK